MEHMDDGDSMTVVLGDLLIGIVHLESLLDTQHVDLGTFHEEELALIRVRRERFIVHHNASG